MPHLNNFSVLPWYARVADQDFRKWWKYGHIYPLFADKTLAIPSQIIRGEFTGYNIVAPLTLNTTYPSAMLVPFGGLVISSAYDGESWVDDYLISTNAVITFAERYLSGWSWTLTDDNLNVIAGGTGTTEIEIADYPTATHLLVERTANYPQIVRRAWELGNDNTSILLPRTTTLHKLDGTLVADIYMPSLWDAKRIGGADIGPQNYDCLIFGSVGNTQLYDGANLPVGQYYLKASDGINEWVSDVITLVEDITPYIIVKWWDDADFYMDAGAIVYTSPQFRNELYLKADIAKPDYELEEEGDERDGVFYPTKQISKKKYNFHFLAPEYLLDVIRLIPMADHIQIEFERPNETVTLYPSTVVITPEWEKEGDVAGVTFEFETNTVAKKIGLAYIRQTE